MTISDGSTADYYELPEGATQLQDLISHRDMNAQLGEIFRAAYRYGMASHSGKLRDAKKIKFYIDAEIKRLEALSGDRSQREHNHIVADQADLMIVPDSFGQQNMIDPADVEISEQPGKSKGCSAKCKGCSAGCRDCCPGLAKLQDEKLARMRAVSAERFINEVYDRIVEPASAIDDDSERMQAIGQNGEMAEEVYAAVDASPKIHGLPSWSDAPEWAEWLAMDGNGEWYWYERQIRAAKRRDLWEYGPISGAVESAAYSPEEVRPDWRTSLQARPAN